MQLNARHTGAEFLGTALLVMSVVGSGIMAQQLTSDVGVQLLANAIATGGALLGLITIFAPLSGASFNPVVTVVMSVVNKSVQWPQMCVDVLVQCAGAVCGAVVANIMFAHPFLETSTKIRTGGPTWFSEVVATVGLLLIIRGGTLAKANVAALVAAWITGAYWFTSSTSIANPAVGFGRMFSDSFAGIAPESWPMFAVMQIVGGVVGLTLIVFLWPSKQEVTA
ncbi:MAG: aquaporin [Acidimicrobiaceae bacterium]|jgi:glycerol uptake facilitator-like aquaporin|nr:aquaporin [Ilumatobacteraceae bacterium]